MRLARGCPLWIIGVGMATIVFDVGTLASDGLLYIIFLIAALLSLAGVILLVIFFRDPERKIGAGIVAAADGVITGITTINDSDVGPCYWVKTFMNIHNVHVNRSPVDGTATKVEHTPGGHLPAFTKDSERNERVTIHLTTPRGTVKVVQIAGTVARRIVPYIKPGDVVARGSRIGLIRLGSRVDVYLPEAMVASLAVRLHDWVKAGEDTLAQLYA